MAGALRKTTIEIDWKINNRMLERADEETDRIVRSADKMERNFNQSARAVDGTTRSIHKQASGVRESAMQVDKLERNFKEADSSARRFGNNSKSAVDKTGRAVDSANNSVRKLDNEIDKTTKNANSRFSALKTTVVAVGGALTVAAGKAMFNYASDTNESLNKVEVAFKDNAKSVKKWSKSTLDNIGLAQGTALDLAATYGDMSTSMGLNTKEAEKMSTSMVDLAGNLASFKNIDIDRANTALNGVFTGETEALKSLGIVMTQTNLEQFALETGAGKVAKSSTEVTKQNIAREKAQKKLNEAIKEHGKNSLEAREAQNKLQEVQAKSHETAKVNLKDMSQEELVRLRYNYVMKQTKNAHGDFKNTSDQAANASRVFSESLKELASNAGQFLLPVITPLITKASDFTKKLSDIPSAVKGMKEKFRPAFEVFESVKDFFKNDLIPSAKELAKNMGPGFMEGGVLAFKALGGVLNATVIPAFKAVTKFTRDNPDSMRKLAKYATVGTAAFLGFKLVTKTIDKVSTAIGRMNSKLLSIGPSATAGATEANVAMSTIGTTPGTSGAGTMLAGSKSKTRLLTKATTGLKSMGKVGKLASGVGVLGVGLSATELIGMNKNNAGEKVGGFGGSVGGMAGGAALGTLIAPGIGTAIGGAIGAFAGTSLGKSLGKYLQKEGPKLLDKFKTGWKGLSKFAEKHPFIGANINAINKIIDLTKKGIKSVVNESKKAWETTKQVFNDDVLSTKVSGKGVSKQTVTAMNSYLASEQQLQNDSTTRKIDGKAMSAKEYETNIKTYEKMENQLVSATNNKASASNKDWDKLLKAGVVSNSFASNKKDVNKETASINTADIKKNAKELKKIEEEKFEEQKKIEKNAANAIFKIKQNAKKKGVKLSKEEKQEIEQINKDKANAIQVSEEVYSKKTARIQRNQRKEATIALSKSAKEQQIILGNLENSKSKMSAKAAAKVVKNSAKQRDATVKEAKKEYKQTKKILDEKRFVTGEISEKEYKEAIKKAKKKKDGTIDQAEKTQQEVVKQAQKQAKGHLREVDWETGESLSKWEQFKNGAIEKFTNIKDAAFSKFGDMKNATINSFSTLKDMSLRVFDNFKTSLNKGINNVITGVNKVLSFFSIPLIPLIGNGKIGASQENKLSSKDKKTYHSTSQSGNLAMNYRGSDSASGKIMAGEEGFEIAYNKNLSQARILGKNGPEITTVEPGTKILNHSESKKMMTGGMGAGTVLPGFAKGTSSISDIASNAIDTVKSISGKVADGASAMWDWVSDPVGKVKSLLDKQGISGSGSNIQGIAGGMFNHFGKGLTKFAKSKLEDAGFGGDVAGPSGGSAKAWAGTIQRAAKAMRVNLSGGELGGIIAQIQRESGGNQKIIQSSAVVDVNTLSGNPARGLLQYIPQTFKSYAVKGHGNILSGYDQLLAFFNNSTWQRDLPYGKRGWGPRGKRRFAKGGRPNVAETVLVGEEGPELFETDSPGTIHTAEKTKQMLNKSRQGGATINFNPTINITVDGGSSDSESTIRKTVRAEMDKLFEKLVGIYNPGEV
ncbi:phage tail tape measure protein [Listeria monocytogenes]|uniref:phage tail tape measure protein n=1 Tax=Listeria monocytogenes TaxID=1639 RepID=UPI000BE0537E|nr:phage tail tape measure protein [Listeria monocytogenes]PCZ07321.1 phage tail tape measure protein [Listeria monocytogenes]PDG13441.1 phage tail tape measure protein [Listeria monocytogenes]